MSVRNNRPFHKTSLAVDGGGGGGGANLMSPPSMPWKLNMPAVRERARGVPGCREVPPADPSANASPTLISFMVGLHQPGRAEALARVNVFCDTGTIGTCRVLCGVVRQTFRRNITSLDAVERMLRHPEKLMAIDESLVGVDDNIGRNGANFGGSGKKAPKSLKKDIELADVGLCILQVERDKLSRHLEILAEARAPVGKSLDASGNSHNNFPLGPSDDERDEEEEEGTESGEDSTTSSLTGMEFQFSLPADVMAQVDQCLKDITKMDKLVKGVATNGKGTVFLYGNGGVAYTPSIPRALYQKLKQLRHSNFSARPSYISLGTRDRYFVAFNDGTADWKGPKALDKCLKKCLASSTQQPKSVSFGSTYDTFFVVFADGSWQYQGRGIPESLEQKLASRDDRADLVTVNLGPSGEWFLKVKNGRMWWSGITEELDKVIADILNAGNYLHFLDFGDSGSYFISYDD